MSTFNYSKKRLAPLVQKYGIDTDRDLIFKVLMQMFDSQTDYQIWALKVVKEGYASVEEVQRIHDWANDNATEIKKLSKQNIISYNKGKNDINTLFLEIEGLGKLQVIKNAVAKFNTVQRNMMQERLKLNEIDALTAANSAEIQEWFDIMKSFNKMVPHRQNKLIRTSSAINDDFNFLKKHLVDSFAESYNWDREDLLRYMQLKAKDCTVVFDKDNVVMLQVPSFDSSKALCGSGRTSWCLTRATSYFNDYVSQKNNVQYFIFDFNKCESDELSHIGFTVNDCDGITHAHSTTNKSLMGGIQYKNEYIDIFGALNNLHISHQIYLKLHELQHFQWNSTSIKNFFNKNLDYMLVYDEGGKLVYRIEDASNIRSVLQHTRINLSSFRFSRNSKGYIIFNLNESFDSNLALGLCIYEEDDYGVETFKRAWDVYGGNITSDNVDKNFGINQKSYLTNADIVPELHLHRSIDRNQESEVVKILNDNAEMDVNCEHHCSLPIFKIVECAMLDGFKAIIKNKNLNLGAYDATGDTIFSHLMYAYLYDTDKATSEIYKSMIAELLALDVDFNIADTIGDTLLILATESKKSNWIVAELLKRSNVNVNIVNDNNYTALTKAIHNNNIQAVKMLLSRKDTVVRQEDIDVANRVGVDLSNWLTESHSLVGAMA